jgi:hypothetical protein
VQVPSNRLQSDELKPFVTWATHDAVYVTTWGSGSCPRIPTSVHARGVNKVVITTVEHDFFAGDNACTSDLGPTTSTVLLPEEIDRTRAVMVDVDGSTSQLPDRP